MNIIDKLAEEQEADKKRKEEGWFSVSEVGKQFGWCRQKAKIRLDAQVQSGAAESKVIIIGSAKTTIYKLK